MERLQKILARAGITSRREAERWIREGRVTVNGSVVRSLGSKADPLRDNIKVDGKTIRQPRLLYYLFHKPAGMIVSLKDPEGRPNLGDWLCSAGIKERLFPVGRLDYNSSGLLLLTNDGALAQRLLHPRYQVKKVYRVKLSGCPLEGELERLRRGIKLRDGVAAADRVRVLNALRKNAWLEIEIHEGKNREVRRLFEALGYFIEKLIRVRLGPLRLASLPPSKMRPLSGREIETLKKTAGF